MVFVGAHFSKAVALEGATAQLATLPADVLQSLLGSGTLQAASEVEVAQVRILEAKTSLNRCVLLL